jgi:PAS domain S-box-containing protein
VYTETLFDPSLVTYTNLLGVGIDITERKEAEERIAKSEQRFRNLSGASLEAIVFTEDGIIVDANEALNRLFGYEGDDLRGRQATGFIEPERRPFTDKRMRARTEGAYETLGLRKDGSTFPIEVNPREFEQDGKRLRISAVRDLAERRKIERQLKDYREHLERLVEERTAEMQEEAARRRAKEEQYLSLVESMVEYVWETDANFIYTYLSSRIYDVLGYNPQELLGKSPADIMPPEEKERAMPLIRKIFSKKKAFTSFQAVHARRDGRLVFIEANGTPYFDKAGTLLGYRGSCHDITEQKEAMDALRDRERQLESKSKTLEEVNAALRVLLKQRENDRKDLEAAFMSNIREMVLPYIQKLQKNSLDPRHRTYLDIAAANLSEIISPFPNTIRQLNFTPREMEVATHIRQGRTTKEAAEIMGVAPSAIHSHRDKIRKKLGLNNQKVNLRSYLLSLK